MKNLFSGLTGTETFGFTDFVTAQHITVVLEPLEDILIEQKNKIDVRGQKMRLTTEKYIDALNLGDLDCVHLLFIPKMYVDNKTHTYNELRQNRQLAICKKFFIQTADVASQFQLAGQYEKKTDPNIDQIHLKDAFVRKIMAIALLTIADKVTENADMPQIKQMISGISSLNEADQVIDQLSATITNKANSYPDTVDKQSIFRILRKQYLQHG